MKRFKLILLACLALLVISCSSKKEDEVTQTPIFKVTYMEKHYNQVDSCFECMAIIDIRGLIEDYSIDGLLYADDIKGINLSIPTNETYRYDTHIVEPGKYYFNISGKHHGDTQLKIVWTSKYNMDKYLVGWHLSYGFGPGCTILMVNLDQHK